MGQNIRIEFFIFHCFINIYRAIFDTNEAHMLKRCIKNFLCKQASYIIKCHLIVNSCTRDLDILKGQKSMFLKKFHIRSMLGARQCIASLKYTFFGFHQLTFDKKQGGTEQNNDKTYVCTQSKLWSKENSKTDKFFEYEVKLSLEHIKIALKNTHVGQFGFAPLPRFTCPTRRLMIILKPQKVFTLSENLL